MDTSAFKAKQIQKMAVDKNDLAIQEFRWAALNGSQYHDTPQVLFQEYNFSSLSMHPSYCNLKQNLN